MNTQTFAREYRYYVMKITDTKTALNQTEQEILDLLIDKVRRSRAHNGKAPLQGVFVENDWPEHDGVWAAIEQRMTGKPPEPLVWPDLECVHDWITEIQDSHQTCVYCKKSEPMEQPA